MERGSGQGRLLKPSRDELPLPRFPRPCHGERRCAAPVRTWQPEARAGQPLQSPCAGQPPVHASPARALGRGEQLHVLRLQSEACPGAKGVGGRGEEHHFQGAERLRLSPAGPRSSSAPSLLPRSRAAPLPLTTSPRGGRGGRRSPVRRQSAPARTRPPASSAAEARARSLPASLPSAASGWLAWSQSGGFLESLRGRGCFGAPRGWRCLSSLCCAGRGVFGAGVFRPPPRPEA